MTEEVLGNNAQTQLRSILERAELQQQNIDVEKEALKEIFAEAKGNGFDTKVIRALLRIRRQDTAKRREELEILQLYAHACGMEDLV